MSACARCGREFQGEPWQYGPGGRQHVDCTEAAVWRMAARSSHGPTAVRARQVLGAGFDTWSNPFDARYGGHCVRCGGTIRVGETICRRGRGPTQYRHAQCD